MKYVIFSLLVIAVLLSGCGSTDDGAETPGASAVDPTPLDQANDVVVVSDLSNAAVDSSDGVLDDW